MTAYEEKDVLLRVTDVGVSYGDNIVLSGVTAEVKDIVRPGCVTGQIIGILGPSGVGKCFAKGTSILMFDGTTRDVETIVEGDRLMGPDSRPRTVLNLGRGVDQMYEIVPVKGGQYTVNAAHILTLRLCRSKRSKTRVDEITVGEYLGKSRTFKNRAKMYRAEQIDFPRRSVPVDPYLFGLWLGDGDSDSPTITAADSEVEIVEAVQELALAAGAEVSRYNYGAANHAKYRIVNAKHVMAGNLRVPGGSRSSGRFFRALRSTGAVMNKHIPQAYKVNSAKVRREVLAGLLDTDGSLQNTCFDIVSKFQTLADDICFVARSLGLAAYCSPCTKTSQTGSSGTYYRVCISGNTNTVPLRVPRKKPSARRQIKNVLHTGFKVVPKGLGEYFGFQLDGDGLFLLGDFTVAHNSQLSRVMTGLQKPTTGTVTVGPKDVPVHAGLVGYVAQNYPLLRHRTVMGNLVTAARRAGADLKTAEEKATKYLDDFKLRDKAERYPSELSGGQRQRIAIAQQLLCSEHYLILDEPTTGLDPVMRDRVCDLIRSVAAMSEENTILCVTHDIASILTIADHLWLLGRVRGEDGKPAGARIVQTFDLIERGLAWQEKPQDLPVYAELQREVRARFDSL